jgi:hypothetical protein
MLAELGRVADEQATLRRIATLGAAVAEERLLLLGSEYGAIVDRFPQASPTLADRHPAATVSLVTENGDRRRLRPPALRPARR